MHSLDARSKIILALIYSVAVFFIDTWLGMACMLGLFIFVWVLSNLPARPIFASCIPVYVICAFTILFNSFPYMEGVVAFSVLGLIRGCFFAIRILLLVWISLVLCLSTTASAITFAFAQMMAPLRKLKVPVDDIATVFSIALRFIPEIASEYMQIKDAQFSRGAPFNEGNLVVRLKAYGSVLLPLVVTLFRRADTLAVAMDARCYGMPGVVRTSIHDARMRPCDIVCMVVGGGCVVILAILL